MVAPVEVGEGGIDILIRNELLKQHQKRNRKAVGAACLAALEQWAEGRGASYARKLVTEPSGGVFGLLDAVVRHQNIWDH
jgi:GNAT superfamily N-acetyltransferase